jgi:uncharacterized OsmC-like protein
MTSYQVRAGTISRDVAEARCKETVIQFDSSAGQSEVLPGPAELLCAAFAACLLKNVERFSHLISFRYRAATVKVTAERQDAPPRFVRIAYELWVATDEPDQRLELLHRNLRRSGTVYNTLAPACVIEGRIHAQRGSDVTAEAAGHMPRGAATDDTDQPIGSPAG